MNSLAQQVYDCFHECLFSEEATEEDHKRAVIVEGIVRKFGFDPDRLNPRKERIMEFLKQMKPEFFRSTGGGYSFMAMFEDRDGVHWAEHPTMEMLAAMGIGIGMVQYCLPREMWSLMPGGVPYLVIKDM